MTHAYDKSYLYKAQCTLGAMLDYAVYDLNLLLSDFYIKFLNSEISKRFETGDSSIIAGKSGVELALDVLTINEKIVNYRPAMNKSPEYWTGWALAYFQWFKNLSFKEINKLIPIDEICKMYNPYHEMDITQICSHLEELYASRKEKVITKQFS